jgi:hypothetical protein
MPGHLGRLQNLIDEHQSSDYLASRSTLECVRDTRVFYPCGMVSQEVVILGEENAPFGSCPFQVLLV